MIVMFDYAGPFLWIALLLGIISEIEGILISLVLPEWTHDVKSFKKALTIRASKLP